MEDKKKNTLITKKIMAITLAGFMLLSTGCAHNKPRGKKVAKNSSTIEQSVDENNAKLKQNVEMKIEENDAKLESNIEEENTILESNTRQIVENSVSQT